MKIGIIGPSDMSAWQKIVEITDETLNMVVDDIVESIIEFNHDIIIVPTKKSLPELVGAKYKDKGGEKLLGVIPLDDEEFGIEQIDEFFCDEIINCVTWRNQPEKLCEESDIIIALGFSPGTLIEIMQSKWFGKSKVLIVEEFISSKLPIESIQKLKLEYIKYDDLEHHILKRG
jgi:hypothetical protein